MQDAWERKLYSIMLECALKLIYQIFSFFFQEKYFANHVSMTNQKRSTQHPKIGPETLDPNEGPLSILEFAFLE